MRTYTAVIERDTETGLLVGQIPGFRGARSQGADAANLRRPAGHRLQSGHATREGMRHILSTRPNCQECTNE
jgi:hypothetical protein